VPKPIQEPEQIMASIARTTLVTRTALALLAGCVAANALAAEETRYFEIHVIDQATGRGVPLVQLKTVNNISYYTDSAGRVAFHEPGLMNQRVFFHVSSHGYEFAKDGFGYRGTRLQVTPGGKATLKIRRLNIAERIYRVTGAGIYGDSQLLGHRTPTRQPVLNGQVFGSDSVVTALYRNRIYWFWGDTNRPSYPLGNFHVPGAISKRPGDGGLDPEKGVDLEYFLGPGGFAKPTAKLPGKGPTWINGLVTLTDNRGHERLFGMYIKIKPPLTVYQRGLIEFDDSKQEWVKVVEFDLQAPLFPFGHPLKRTENGVEYVYFGDPFPLVRVEATAKKLADLSNYQSYTCLAKGSHKMSLDVVRTGETLEWSWKPDTVPFTPQLQARLIKQERIKPREGLFQLHDDDGKPILIHRGSVCWNEFRRKWIMIGNQQFGSSFLGEVWYAESETPTGPWTHARRIVTHQKYSFYNPRQHSYFDKHGGRIIFFEGTYTTLFSGNDQKTPRYDYNQVMYKLDLGHPDLQLTHRSTSPSNK
jgi:hypothetical protein